MSDTEEEKGIGGVTDHKQYQFMLILKEFPILLDKSQVPEIKERKTIACLEMIKKLSTSLNWSFTKDTLPKKISRMKADVKTKSDKTKTGNKKIVLKDWEKIMYDLINGDSNPSVSMIPVL